MCGGAHALASGCRSDADGPIAVELVEPIFYDPKGARLDA